MSRLIAGALCATMFACSAPAPSSSSPPPVPPQTSFAISGRISDLTTGVPLAAANITILDGPNASRAASSDAAGMFRLADLTKGGLNARVRHDGYDSVFRGINLVADTVVDVSMTRAMTTLSGMWAGTLSFSPKTGARQDVAIRQLTMMQTGGNVSSTFTTVGSYEVAFTGTLQDPAAVTETTSVTGTFTLSENLSGRNPTTCRGTSSFSGTINWTQMATATPQIVLDCGITYTNVTLALVRPQ
jgi:Carboxypeptidase regulatory-like domain